MPFFKTRGVVIVPNDLTLEDWPERARRANLTTIALHHGNSPRAVEKAIQSQRGQEFLDKCRQLELEVEYELHAIRQLLPRNLFEKDPSMFRMNEKGQRVPDVNLCVHSKTGVEIVCENAVKYGQTLRPTTGRYFYWIDDNKPMCRCLRCRDLSDSDQSLMLENQMLKALRNFDPRAKLAHLAYGNTLKPPTRIKPKPGVFLEFAPIPPRPLKKMLRKTDPDFVWLGVTGVQYIEALDANLQVFDETTAQVLEYWLDVSRWSNYRIGGWPLSKVPWDDSVVQSDLDIYGSRGIRHITTFAACIDATYVKQFGDPPLDQYGAALLNWRAK